MNQEEQGKKWGRIVAKAWSDAVFKQELLARPAETLRAEGITIPVDVEVRILEDDGASRYVVLPMKPDDLSDADLDGIAAGGGGCWFPLPRPIRPQMCQISGRFRDGSFHVAPEIPEGQMISVNGL